MATHQECHLGERETNLLMAIGSWAAITIENARLHRQARRLAVLEERERIGMDLHDGIIQSIYGVGLALDYARMALEDDPKQARLKIEQSIEALNSTIRDIRSYILDLRPRQFHGQDLMQGLRRLVDEFPRQCGRRSYPGGSGGRLDRTSRPPTQQLCSIYARRRLPMWPSTPLPGGWMCACGR